MPSNDAEALGKQGGAQRSKRAAQGPAPDILTPADRYQELSYRAQCREPGFDLSAFVHANFRPTLPTPSEYVSVPGQPIGDHIESLWEVLSRHGGVHASLLQLPHPYLVPGGVSTAAGTTHCSIGARRPGSEDGSPAALLTILIP